MKRSNERGSALVFTLILVLVLSVMAASLMFLARSETWSGMNYRMMTQARYAAEAGINASANYLINTYVPPAALANGTFTGFNTSVYPVQDLNGNPIYLSSLSTQPANYPNTQMQAQFAGASTGTLQAGNATVNYTASAQLMTMVSIIPFGTTTPMTIQTWQITAHGDIASVRNAEAEVVTTLERYISPAFSYAAFADGSGCGQISFTGNGTTDSYDSSTLTPNGGTINPTVLGTSSDPFNTFGGNIGTNGNDNNSGSNVIINGSLSVPNPSFGVCTSGNVTGLSGGNLSQITGGFVQLPSPVNFPIPTVYPPGTTPITMTNGQQQLGPCNVAPCSYSDISLSGGSTKTPTTLTLTPGVYDINSLSISGNAQIAIAPDPTTGQYGTVIINVAGNNNSTPITITGNAINNPTYDASLVQITYAGSGTVQIAGNGASAAVVYAPNATVDFKGNGQFFGSVIANQLTDVGNGQIHYDLKLKKKLFTVGNYVLQSFTWNKY